MIFILFYKVYEVLSLCSIMFYLIKCRKCKDQLDLKIGLSPIFSKIFTLIANGSSLWTFFFWYCYLFIKFIWNSKTRPSCMKMTCKISFLLHAVWGLTLIKICSWGWILLHILLHPLRKLSFVTETESNTFRRIWFETSINIVTWLSCIFWSWSESRSFWNTET